MAEKPKNYGWYTIFGHNFHWVELLKLGAIALFGLIVAAILLYFTIGEQLRSGEMSTMSDVEETVLNIEELSPLEKFFDRYLADSGMAAIQSIRATGIYTVNDLEFELTFLAKSPRSYKQTMQLGDRLIEVGYDGQEAWIEQSHEMIEVSNEPLMRLNQMLAIMESAIPCLAWDHEFDNTEAGYELMPDSVFEGHDCYVIKNLRLIDGVAVYHFIDKNTLFEHYRRASVQIDERRFKDVELYYGRDDESIPRGLPDRIELLVDGVSFYKVHFNTIEVNAGLPNFLFRKN